MAIVHSYVGDASKIIHTLKKGNLSVCNYWGSMTIKLKLKKEYVLLMMVQYYGCYDYSQDETWSDDFVLIPPWNVLSYIELNFTTDIVDKFNLLLFWILIV